MHTIYLHGASNLILPRILNAEVPWIWILGHRPNTYVEFWETKLPLSKSGSTHRVRTRDIAYDLVFETFEFMRIYEEFKDHGMSLVQATKPMPNTLLMDRIEEKNYDKVLKANGAYLQFFLPHAFETCQIKCWDRAHLESILADQGVAYNGD